MTSGAPGPGPRRWPSRGLDWLRRQRCKLKDNSWWVCHWWTDTPVGYLAHQEGSFAALGETRERAEADVQRQLGDMVYGVVEVKYTLHRPGFLEKLLAG